jgi:3'-phosphoadenosine 5'-phosphosulfate (PAPS) 3'-phosphatase
VSVFIRLPRAGYQEYIWDAAAGCILVQEAGGTVTDLEGAPLNFSSEAAKGDGARLSKGVAGIVATSGAGGPCSSGVHAKVLAALREARHPL